MEIRAFHPDRIEPTFDRCSCFWVPHVVERIKKTHPDQPRFRARCGITACPMEVEANDWVELWTTWNRFCRTQNAS